MFVCPLSRLIFITMHFQFKWNSLSSLGVPKPQLSISCRTNKRDEKLFVPKLNKFHDFSNSFSFFFFFYLSIFGFSGYALFKFAVTCHLSVLKFVHNCALHRIAYFFLRSFINFSLIYAYYVRGGEKSWVNATRRHAKCSKVACSSIAIQ